MSSAADRLNAVFSEFEVALTRLSDSMQHIVDSRPRADLLVLLLNNAIVALSATVEEGLRALFQEYLAILEDGIENCGWLRPELQKSNMASAIDELRKLNGARDIKGAHAIITNIELCTAGKPGFRLMRAEITYNQGNFKSKQLTETAKACGLAELWRLICDSAAIESHTGEIDTSMRINRVTAQWNELFDERDLVVHRLSQANGWSKDRISQSAELSRIILKRITECLTADAEEQIAVAEHRKTTQAQDAPASVD